MSYCKSRDERARGVSIFEEVNVSSRVDPNGDPEAQERRMMRNARLENYLAMDPRLARARQLHILEL